jgi:hypothetical protein
MERDEIGREAVAHWQDKFSKFWPTAKGPTVPEVEMYIAGHISGRHAQNELMAALADEHEKMHRALTLIAGPMRPDGTFNLDRQACADLARQALEV